jgi:hypothetical protein
MKVERQAYLVYLHWHKVSSLFGNNIEKKNEFLFGDSEKVFNFRNLKLFAALFKIIRCSKFFLAARKICQLTSRQRWQSVCSGIAPQGPEYVFISLFSQPVALKQIS